MKTLREQMHICKDSGNLIKVDVSKHQYKLIAAGVDFKPVFVPIETINVCLKHKKACDGSVCKEERGIK